MAFIAIGITTKHPLILGQRRLWHASWTDWLLGRRLGRARTSSTTTPPAAVGGLRDYADPKRC